MRQNAEKDPNYNPYCMRCIGLIRMKKVEPFLWKCHCGAIHDERITMEMNIRMESSSTGI